MGANGDVIDGLLADLERARVRVGRNGRPFVTLAYAQSLDGSIAVEPGRPSHLSCPESLRLTHALRANHDSILVGIGTVLADDPQLTVRLVEGRSPRPLVVDSHLRTPECARLLDTRGREGRAPWIATTNGVDNAQRNLLEARGARILKAKALPNGWVDLPSLMHQMAEQGVAHVMVEGGSKIITSFLRARLVDYAVITVSPRLMGGLAALRGVTFDGVGEPRLSSWATHRLGDDLVLCGELRWTPG